MAFDRKPDFLPGRVAERKISDLSDEWEKKWHLDCHPIDQTFSKNTLIMHIVNEDLIMLLHKQFKLKKTCHFVSNCHFRTSTERATLFNALDRANCRKMRKKTLSQENTRSGSPSNLTRLLLIYLRQCLSPKYARTMPLTAPNILGQCFQQPQVC